MESLATELLHEIKEQSKRWFIAFIVCLSLLFASNIAWLIAWNIPIEQSVVTTTVTSDDDGNANFINGTGDIVNGSSSEN